MYGTDAADSVAVKPAKDAAGGVKWFSDGPPGTVVDHDVMNMLLDELQPIVTQIGGLALDKTNDNQIYPILWHVRGIRSTTADDTGLTTPDLRAVVACTTCDVGGPRSAVIASIDSDCVTGGAAGSRLVAASDLGTIANNSSQAAVIASTSGSVSGAIGGAMVAASLSSSAQANQSATLACSGCTVSGSRSATAASLKTQATGVECAVIASEGITAGGADCTVAGSRNAIIASLGTAANKVTIAAGAEETAVIACADVAIGGSDIASAAIASQGVTTGAATDGAVVASKDVTLTQCTESAVVASENVTINTTNGAILIGACDFAGAAATVGGATVCSAMIACEDDASNAPTIGGASSSTISCLGNVTVSGNRSTAIACETGAGTGPVVSGNKAAAIASDGQFDIQATNCVVLASTMAAAGINLTNGAGDQNAVLLLDNAFTGVGGDTTYRSMHFAAVGGTGTSDGGFTGAGIDYAEYFENATEGVLPVGAIVSHTGGKARLAQDGDRVLGIVSAKPAFAAGGADLHWHGLKQADEFGVEARDEQGRCVVSQKHDEDKAEGYVPRRKRPAEWTCVGLMGQLRVRVDATVKAGSYVVPGKDGIGTHADEPPRTGRPIECFEVLHKPTKKRGCGVALCLVG
jgi:hypothetical protein